MPLTPPTVEELETFRHDEAFPEDEHEYLDFILQMATDAVWVFTGVDSYPKDARKTRIFQYAIMDLTLWLLSQAEHRDEINAPFNSERIGSYSYSKMQQASRGEDTGIYWLNLLFAMLRSPGEDGSSSWVSSERVFNPEGYTFEEKELADKVRVLYQDPSEPWGY